MSEDSFLIGIDNLEEPAGLKFADVLCFIKQGSHRAQNLITCRRRYGRNSEQFCTFII